jgi:Na+/H+-dicarboxylate symporter
MAKRLTYYILIGLVLGAVVGLALNGWLDDGTAAGAAQLKQIADYLHIGTTIFLRLIKMIIAPLVFATLVSGIAQMGDTSTLGRVGIRSVAWFVVASLISLSLGLILVNVLQPGVGLNLPLPPAGEATGLASGSFDLAKFIAHIFPASIIEAMGTNEVLQIVVFSLFVGVAMTAVPAQAAPLVRAIDAIVPVMLQVTDYVMRFAPVAVFCAIAATLAERGAGVIGQLAYFMMSFYLGLIILWAVLIGIGFLIIGPRRCWSRSPPPRPRRPFRGCWRRWRGSGCRPRSPVSCCRSAIRSTSTARCCTAPLPRCSSRKPMASTSTSAPRSRCCFT